MGRRDELLLIPLAVPPLEPDARGDNGGLAVEFLLEAELGQRVAGILSKRDSSANLCKLWLRITPD